MFASPVVTPLLQHYFVSHHADIFCNGIGPHVLDPGDVIGVTHPGYPGPYNNDVDCYIKITASNNGSIRLTLVDFYVENTYDNLVIYRGNHSSIAQLTGQVEPHYYESPDILLHFQSDSTSTRRGFVFQAEWITAVSKYLNV